MLNRALLLLGIVTLCIWAPLTAAEAVSLQEKPDKQGAIAVTGVADEEVAPDTVEFYLEK